MAIWLVYGGYIDILIWLSSISVRLVYGGDIDILIWLSSISLRLVSGEYIDILTWYIKQLLSSGSWAALAMGHGDPC